MRRIPFAPVPLPHAPSNSPQPNVVVQSQQVPERRLSPPKHQRRKPTPLLSPTFPRTTLARMSDPSRGRIRPKHRVEYLLLRAVGGLVTLLPYRAALTLGWCIARLAFHLVRFRRKEAIRRLHEVFGPDLPSREAHRIAYISLRNVIFNAIEIMRTPRITPAWLARVVDDYQQTAERIRRFAANGAVVAVPHMGNWEMAGLAAYYADLTLLNIAAEQRNPLVNRYLNRLRERPGIETLQRGSGTMRQVLRRLLHGHVLAILPDVRIRTPDLELPFLNGTANLGRGVGQFARLANVPIVPCIVSRRGWARHRAQILDPILPDKSLDKEADVRRMTQLVVSRIDQAIQEHPEQWFWYNKRWVLEPLET